MPELPEVETVRRGLEPHLTKARIEAAVLNRADLRFPFPTDFAARLTGQKILSVNRRAKYLLVELESGEVWLSHLGMTGNFTVSDAPEKQSGDFVFPETRGKHDHVQLILSRPDGAGLILTYSDPRRFGFMDMCADSSESAYLNALGPEPLGNEFNAAHMAARFTGRKTPIKSALLDQRNVAGLGNIYVCEALWRAGIAPTTQASALVQNDHASSKLQSLATSIRDVLEAAIAAGGSTLKDFKSSDGAAGYFQHSFDVYGREEQACRTPDCTGSIARIVQSGRSTFYCPDCQSETS